MDKSKKDKQVKKDKKDKQEKDKKKSSVEQIKFKGIHNCKYHHCGNFEIGVFETEKIIVCPDTHRKVLKSYFNNYDNCSFTPNTEIYGEEDSQESEDDDESDKTSETSQDESEDNEEEEEEEEEDFEIGVIFKEFPDLMIVFSGEYVDGLKLGADVEKCSFLESSILKKRINDMIFVDNDFIESKLKTDYINFYNLLKALKEKIETKSLGSLSQLFPLFEKCFQLKPDKKVKKEKDPKDKKKSKKFESEDESDDDEEDEAIHWLRINVYNGKDCDKIDTKQIATWCARTWEELKELDYQLDYVDGDRVIKESELNLKISLPLLRPKIIKINAINGESFTISEILDNISREYMKIYDEQGTDYRNSEKLVDYTELIDVRYRRLYQKALSLWKKLMKEKHNIKSNIPNVVYEFDEEEPEDDEKEDKKKSGKEDKEEQEEGEEEGFDEYDETNMIDFFQSSGENPIFLFYRPDSLDYSCLEYNSKTKTICPVLDIDKIGFMECTEFEDLRDLLFDVAEEFNPNGRYDET